MDMKFSFTQKRRTKARRDVDRDDGDDGDDGDE